MLEPLNYTIYQLLSFFYKLVGGNLGLSIILVTIVIKVLLLPLVIPSMKSAKAIQNLKPELDALKNKYKDKKELQEAQMKFYKEKGINPLSGCFPQIIQILILISLYNVFMNFLKQPSIAGITMNPYFLYLDLTKPDKTYIMPILSGLTQFVFSFMLQSGVESHVHNPKSATEKKKEEDSLEMAQTMQQQMLYMMPIMTTVVSINFQSGLVLYWVFSTIFSIVQQYYFSGLGGLVKIKNILPIKFK